MDGVQSHRQIMGFVWQFYCKKSSKMENHLFRKNKSNNGHNTHRGNILNYFFYHEHHICQWIVSCTFLKKKQKKKVKKRKNNINGLFFPMCFFCLFTIWCKYDWLKYRLISADSSLSDKPFLSFTYLFDLFVHLADDLDKHASSSFF